MTRLHRLKVKITIQGHVIYPLICVRSISSKPFELISLNCIQTVLSVRLCAKHMTQPRLLNIKVTGQEQGIYP